MFVYKMLELFPNGCLNVFAERWVISDYLPGSFVFSLRAVFKLTPVVVSSIGNGVLVFLCRGVKLMLVARYIR